MSVKIFDQIYKGKYSNSMQGHFFLVKGEATEPYSDKEVFVKHEQAPSAPKLEGVCFFVDDKYIFYENRYFWPI